MVDVDAVVPMLVDAGADEESLLPDDSLFHDADESAADHAESLDDTYYDADEGLREWDVFMSDMRLCAIGSEQFLTDLETGESVRTPFHGTLALHDEEAGETHVVLVPTYAVDAAGVPLNFEHRVRVDGGLLTRDMMYPLGDGSVAGASPKKTMTCSTDESSVLVDMDEKTSFVLQTISGKAIEVYQYRYPQRVKGVGDGQRTYFVQKYLKYYMSISAEADAGDRYAVRSSEREQNCLEREAIELGYQGSGSGEHFKASHLGLLRRAKRSREEMDEDALLAAGQEFSCDSIGLCILLAKRACRGHRHTDPRTAGKARALLAEFVSAYIHDATFDIVVDVPSHVASSTSTRLVFSYKEQALSVSERRGANAVWLEGLLEEEGETLTITHLLTACFGLSQRSRRLCAAKRELVCATFRAVAGRLRDLVELNAFVSKVRPRFGLTARITVRITV
jgi:hypothetical protein